MLVHAITPVSTMFAKKCLPYEIKGGYLDFSHLTELKNIYIYH